MVICLHCALNGRIHVLHIETWFVTTRHGEEVTRYWKCPTCLSRWSQVIA